MKRVTAVAAMLILAAGAFLFLGGCDMEMDSAFLEAIQERIAEDVEAAGHKVYTVSFNSNGGSAVESQTVMEGEKITKPTDPTKEDSYFTGWYKDHELETLWSFSSDTVTADITLYAKWSNIPFYEVSLTYEGTSISSGEEIDVGGCTKDSSEEYTFTITNQGTNSLSIEDVSVSGTVFSISQQPLASVLATGSSSTFKTIFSPVSTDSYTETLTITFIEIENFVFNITGEGTLAEIKISKDDGTTEIPTGTGIYNFDSQIAGSTETASFIIHNTGTSVLNLTGTPAVTISGSGAFTVQTQPSQGIDPGNTSSFVIAFTPLVASEQTATVSIANNDSDENPYTFTLTGSGLVPGAPSVTGPESTMDTTPTWSWTSGGGGSGTYRVKIDDSDLSSGATVTTETSHTSLSILGYGSHTLYIQERNSYGVYGDTGNRVINVVEVMAVGWIGGGSNGWKTTAAPSSGVSSYYLNGPIGLAADAEGNIYIGDSVNQRVSKWSSSGNAIGWIGHGVNGWQTGNASTTTGTDYRSFNGLYGVAIDNSGNIYVADVENHRICKWSSAGVAQGWIGGGSNGWKTTTAPSVGASDYQSFRRPTGVYVDNDGYIYVADQNNYRVSKWDSSGNAVGWIGGGTDGWKTTTAPSSASTGFKSFGSLLGLFVDTSGNIYAAEETRISKWNSAGTALGWIGGGTDGWKTTSGPTSGSNAYRCFRYPYSVFVDTAGNIYVPDTWNNRVYKWNSTGTAIGWIGGGSDGWKTGTAPSSGTDYRSFYSPAGIFVDISGNIFIAESANDRVSKWDQAP